MENYREKQQKNCRLKMSSIACLNICRRLHRNSIEYSIDGIQKTIQKGSGDSVDDYKDEEVM